MLKQRFVAAVIVVMFTALTVSFLLEKRRDGELQNAISKAHKGDSTTLPDNVDIVKENVL